MADHKRLIVIQCGEKTCASEPGKFCTFLRVSHFSTQWSCHLYEVRIDDDAGDGSGWLLRTKKCLADFSAA